MSRTRWVRFQKTARNGKKATLIGCVVPPSSADCWYVEYPYRGQIGLIISHRTHFTEIDMNGNAITPQDRTTGEGREEER